ncbi:MAG: sigma-70 family RNA polymerase sigma factor [Gelidibacter sp.]
MDLREIITACKRKNLEAQSQLYELYKDDLYFLCLKYCRNIPDAEDNLHDGFIAILDQIKKFNGKGSFEGWMKRIIINKAIDKYKKKTEVNIEINNDLLGDTLIESENLDIPLDSLLLLIQELPDRYRLVFNLYELDSFGHKEISNMLKISEGTSKSNLNRAKQILKKKIKQMSSKTIKPSCNGN